jgi:uncharacterized protein (DUF1800 family)
MSYSPRRAEVRFGCGLSPSVVPAGDAAALLDRLKQPDEAARRFPVETFDEFRVRIAEQREMMAEARATGTRNKAARDARRARRKARLDEQRWMAQALLRRATTRDGFRERLTAFWADHFTVVGKGGLLRFGELPYVEQSIRPHVAGRFGDMLKAVATAPMMLRYLDQERSTGPNSAFAVRHPGAGVNENLAREMLELHTLGVDGGYSQTDVSELALLLAGLSVDAQEGFTFRTRMTEPGAQRVLGVSYGSDGPGSLAEVHAALDDLARHPATAAHLARKLAVHFTGDDPDAGLVAAMAAAYRDSDGALVPVYAAMLAHPAAWTGAGNVKAPVDYVGSALRALSVGALPVRQADKLAVLLSQPLDLMGQPWMHPEGPDGWPERDEDWITPQGLAGRLQWALNVPQVLVEALPDPRAFLKVALPDPAPEALRFAAGAAETRAEGIALILASPAFQRM